MPPSTHVLTRTQKAAIVVHLLLNEGADPGISDLPEEAQRRLVAALVSLKYVDRETLGQVIAEFAAELDANGLRLPGTLPGVLTLMDGRISADLMSEFSAQAPAGAAGALGRGTWDMLAAMPNEQLLEVLKGETPEVCAILLSKLPATQSAKLLAEMAPDRAAEVTVAFAGTEAVQPDVIARIGLSLGRALSNQPSKGFDTPPVDRMAAVLNSATSGDRNRLLEELDKAAPDFAARVRRAVFSWENIPDRVDPRDLPRVLREVENATVVTALAAAPNGPVATFILGGISKRLGEQMRGEIEERGTVPEEEAEDAQRDIANAVRTLEEAGTITLTSSE